MKNQEIEKIAKDIIDNLHSEIEAETSNNLSRLGCDPLFANAEKGIVEAILKVKKDTIEQCAKMACYHTTEKGTGIYEMQYKECCITASAIRKLGG